MDTIIPIINDHKGDLISNMYVLDDEAAIEKIVQTIAAFSPEPRAVDFFTDLIKDDRFVTNFAPIAFLSLMKDRATSEDWPEIITTLKPYFDEMCSHEGGQVIMEGVAEEFINIVSNDTITRGQQHIDIICLVPDYGGIMYSDLPNTSEKEALWDKYYTEAPEQRR